MNEARAEKSIVCGTNATSYRPLTFVCNDMETALTLEEYEVLRAIAMRMEPQPEAVEQAKRDEQQEIENRRSQLEYSCRD